MGDVIAKDVDGNEISPGCIVRILTLEEIRNINPIVAKKLNPKSLVYDNVVVVESVYQSDDGARFIFRNPIPRSRFPIKSCRCEIARIIKYVECVDETELLNFLNTF